MSAQTPDELEAAVRARICCGVYEDAQRIVEEYARAMDARLHTLASDPAAMEAAARQALRLLHWARLMVQAQRAHCRRHLRELPSVTGYRIGAKPPAAVDIEA
jgi:hypothetical protein